MKVTITMQIDKKLWTKFKEKSKSEGLFYKFVYEQLIKKFIKNPEIIK